jgi:hypothetical protein
MGADLMSELAGFRSTVPDPRHQPDPVVLRGIVASLRAVWDEAPSFGVADDFLRRMTGDFIECLRRLDGLPRDDPFWEGTNRRPTQYKMIDFCRKAIRDDPEEEGDAYRMLAAVEVLSGHYFDPLAWGRLLTEGLSNASWPVYAALIGSHFGGYYLGK